MASPIRPTLPEFQPPARSPQAGEAARAAQRAFFDAALGKAQAGAATPPQAVASAKPEGVARPVSPPTDAQPEPYARPGSLLNIRV